MPTDRVDLDVNVTDHTQPSLAALQERIARMEPANSIKPLDAEDTIVCYDDGRVFRLDCSYDPATCTLSFKAPKKGRIIELLVQPGTTIGVSTWVSLWMERPRFARKGERVVLRVEDN
jgi:hypothetical protein